MSVAVGHSDSPEGRAALLAAAAEAALMDTELLVLHVVGGVDPTPGRSQLDRLDTHVRTTLADGGSPPVRWSLRTAAEGNDAGGALVDLLTETGAELLVLGSRRRSAVGKLLLGSTVQRVVLDSPVPVLVVKAHYR